MTQDFENKISVCIRKDLPEWQQLNAAAHIAAYFGNQLGNKFGTGAYFVTSDQVKIPRNTQYGIVMLRADNKDLRRVTRRATEADVQWMGFTQDMLDLLDDNELQTAIGKKTSDEIEYLGVGLYGSRVILEGVTKGIQAWK
jgi:hypothetical protein